MAQWRLVRNGADYEALSKEYGLDPVILRIMRNRGITEAEQINEYDPRVTWNLAYIYINIGDDKNAIKYMDKMIEPYRFYNGAYDMYCEYLKRRYIDTGNLEYKNIQNRVEKYKDVNLEKLNFKSKYMNNQLK